MNYKELRAIDVTDRIKRKGSLNYLSWSFAVDELMLKDPSSTWEFPDPKFYNDTCMVFCNVTAFGKTMKMHLPVMDHRNNAIKQPDTRRISDAQMRCLTKCIASFGIGLFIYQNEDLPPEEESAEQDKESELQDYINKIQASSSPAELRTAFSVGYTNLKKYKILTAKLKEVYEIKKGELNASS